MLKAEIWAEIRRLYFNEGYSKKTISKMLKIHRNTVSRAIKQDKQTIIKKIPISKIVPYQGMILEILKRYPQLSAVRIHQEIQQKGYTGSISLLCEYLRKVRGSKKEAFLRIETLPGEQAQVDWANFGWIEIGGYKRRLSCFVMVLSYSRIMYIEFRISEKTEDFISCHINAFNYFGGVVPKKILYDNLKSVVLIRYGKEIQFNERFLDFAGHYLFQPVICNPGQAHEKGRVEAGIKYVRNNFWAGREFKDLEDINKQSMEWLEKVANIRIHATTHQRPVDRFNNEKDKLNKTPEIPYDTAIIQPCQSNKDCRVKFDSNCYSVPFEYADHILTLKATEKEVLIYSDEKLIARHTRSYLKYQVIEEPKHYEGLLEKKKRAREYKIRDIFLKLTPKAKDYVEGLLQTKINITYQLNKILLLCQEYSQEEVVYALEHALEFGAFGYEYIKNIIIQNRTKKHIPDEAGEVSITKQKEWGDICVTPHDLSKYDEIEEEPSDGKNKNRREPEVS